MKIRAALVISLQHHQRFIEGVLHGYAAMSKLQRPCFLCEHDNDVMMMLMIMLLLPAPSRCIALVASPLALHSACEALVVQPSAQGGFLVLPPVVLMLFAE